MNHLKGIERKEYIKHERDVNKLTYAQLSEKLGITRQRVEQIYKNNNANYKQPLSGELADKLARASLTEDILEKVKIFSTIRCRRKEVIDEKKLLVRQLRDQFKFTFMRIALLLNNDHSTIMHLYYNGRRKNNPKNHRRI